MSNKNLITRVVRSLLKQFCQFQDVFPSKTLTFSATC
jgi:hypothetical protein